MFHFSHRRSNKRQHHKPRPTGRRGNCRLLGGFEPSLERLEARTLLAGQSIFWTGADAATNPNWSDAKNWDGNIKPSAGDYVFFGSTGKSLPSHVDAGFAPGGALLNIVLGNDWTGTITLDQGVDLQSFDLLMGGGTLGGPGNLTLKDILYWDAGTLAGTGTTTVQAGAKIDLYTDVVSPTLAAGHTLDNFGTLTWHPVRPGFTANHLTMQPGSDRPRTQGATIINEAGATFDVQADDDIVNSKIFGTPSPAPEIINKGTFEKTAGTGTLNINVPVTNSSSVVAAKGTMAFHRGYTQTAGGTDLLGGAVSSTTALAIQGGSLSGQGTIFGDVNNIGGTLNPLKFLQADSGELHITGNYTQGPAGNYAVDLDGTTPVTQFDQVFIDGTATLGGTLHVSLGASFTPAPGNKFDIMVSGSETGDFATKQGLDIRDNLYLTPSATAFGIVSLTARLELSVSGSSVTATVGIPFSGLVATVTDADPSDTAADLTAAIDWGDGNSSAGTVVADGNGGFAVSGSHVYTTPASNLRGAVTVTDGGGSNASALTTANVFAPLNVSGTALIATEGRNFTAAVATFTDPNSAAPSSDYTATLDWGDGGVPSAGTVNGPDSGGAFTVSAAHVYAEEAVGVPIAVTIVRAGKGSGTGQSTVQVVDASLTAMPITIAATEGVTFSGAVADFVDTNPNPDVADFTAAIDWGDGTASAGTVAVGASGGFVVNGSHTYGQPGNLAVEVTIADHGASATANATAVVNHATASTPSANADLYMLSQSATSSTNPSGGVLANDSGQHPLSARLAAGPSHGSLSLAADGSFSYAPGAGFRGLDRFTYLASDSNLSSAPATVTLLSHNASIVRKFYLQVLDREPDDDGLQFWTGLVDSGAPFSSIFTGFYNSDERLNPIISQYYVDFLLRQVEPSGLEFWKEQYIRDGGPEHVIAGMISSPEFFQSAGGTNDGYVRQLYLRLLGRPAEDSGLAYWTGHLNSGDMGRADVVLSFQFSEENRRLLIEGWHRQFLGRSATATESNQFLAELQQGASQRQVQMELIDGLEYRDSPPAPAAGAVLRLLT